MLLSTATVLFGTPDSAPSRDARDRNAYIGAPKPGRPFVKKFVANFLLDQKDIWTSPFHINQSSAKWWALTGAGTAILLAIDHPVSQALPTHGESVDFGTAASRAGQWYTVFPAAGALLGAGWVFHDDKLVETGALSLQALADADLVANVFKVVARRQRPLDGDRGGHFEKGGSSFPSGHSTQAWALASVIADEYGNHKWVPFVSYGYAVIISASRVAAQEHFTSDVFVGAAVGFFVGRYVVRTQRIHREHLSQGHSRLYIPTVLPTVTTSALTLNLSWQLDKHGSDF
ncbi:MAG TPA: phosphatase PAP2 family protein [Bryobacteraceae bacterium]|nr:phosphatase PAP2 family protein [Bryobacteraceae bacterium]